MIFLLIIIFGYLLFVAIASEVAKNNDWMKRVKKETAERKAREANRY